MREFIIALLEASIAMSIIALVYMAITPLVSKKFTAKGRYYAWLVIVVGLIIPFRFHPQGSAIDIDTLIAMKTTNSPPTEYFATVVSSNLPWHVFVGGIWLAGVTLFVTTHIIRHKRFLKMVKRWSTEIVDQQVIQMLHDVQLQLRIKQQPDLRVCPNISSPMLLGFLRPTILLPSENIPPDELPFILKHELVHFKRRDVWYKALVCLASALHWFNPLVYIIAREIAIQCEISCDEEVVKNTDRNSRQKYVEAIIGVIRKHSKVSSKFSTNFYGGKQGMKHRVFSIMDSRSKKWGVSIFAMIVVATLSTGAVLNVSASTSPRITPMSVSEDEINKNRMDTDPDTRGDGKVHQPFLEKDETSPGKEGSINSTLSTSTEAILLMGKDDNTFNADHPQLVEMK
ncbi:Signal transducer regulating beta-lactamase production, contains metallopeptidase domain [Evansella caseinilytica]|uniref:Signal transducer regulating beta-lactamase production, contains metallopeptidase domain n=1 Tax=Evansella caseinilytica TaxID=1503961 RepID=A0A1H3V0Z0_9BACI|nr:M56 family metallopeptidase [Evansella caseinilytica]SDZ68332.1 Signal transducer regulating beta-lactamase production, contains metallopeptidase domain [Evansella caseinilytica]